MCSKFLEHIELNMIEEKVIILRFNKRLQMTHPSNSLMDSTVNPKGENIGRIRSSGMFLGLQHFGGRGVC